MEVHIVNRRKENYHILAKDINCNILKSNKYFSKSHSDNIVVFAGNQNAKIGIDIEKNIVRSQYTIDFFFKNFVSLMC